MDTIFLSGLTTECIIGIWDWSAGSGRRSSSISRWLPISAAPRRRLIDDTLDYKRVSKRCCSSSATRSSSSSRPDRAHRRDRVREFDVTWVRVRLNKQGAIRGARDVGIQIERRREDFPRPAPEPLHDEQGGGEPAYVAAGSNVDPIVNLRGARSARRAHERCCLAGVPQCRGLVHGRRLRQLVDRD